jgi:hypothetical protein
MGWDVCINAIAATDCTSFLDKLNTAYNKCAQDKVCSGG